MASESSEVVPYGPQRRPWRETLSEMAVGEGGQLLVSPPSSDPLTGNPSPVPEGITPELYQVPSSGLPSIDHDRAMVETEKVVKLGAESVCGTMSNRSGVVPAALRSPLGTAVLNNGGDPFLLGTAYSHHLKWMARNVLDYYASLWNARWPHRQSDPDSYWGYVLTMGSTEGNLHALWSARNYLSTLNPATSVPGHIFTSSPAHHEFKVPVVFFSRNSNYSLYKCCDIVNLPTFDSVGRALYPKEDPLGGEWQAGVPCTGGDSGPGTIDVDALELLVNFFSSRGHPIIVVFNYGTTFKCGYDDVEMAGERLVEILKKNNMFERTLANPEDSDQKCSVRQGFWFHVDGAIGASYMPFLQMAYRKKLTDVKPASVFDFRLDFIMSVVTSGHKFVGLPWPTGVYIVRNVERLKGWDFPYFSSFDRTVSLSRNGHSAVLFWSFVSRNSYDTQVSTILKCLEMVDYVLSQFHRLQEKIGVDLWVAHTPPSLSVVFRRPNPDIVRKHTLSTGTARDGAGVKLLAQVFAVPHLTRERVDELVASLESSGAFE